MTPKEKAQELYDKFWLNLGLDSWEAKPCTKICIEEIMKAEEAMWDTAKKNLDKTDKNYLWISYIETPFYNNWQEVKQELQKL